MVPVLIARDRARNTGAAILADMRAPTIGAALLPMLGTETLLCSDAAGSYGTIARAAYRVTDEQVQALRDAGWSDEQIAEAAYVAALFSLFVRLADTFDIVPPAVYEPHGIPAAVTRKDESAGP